MQCKKSSVLTRRPVSLLSQNTHDYVIQCFMLQCMLGFSGDSSRTWHCQIFYLCTIGIAHHKYVLGKIKLFLKCFLSFFNTKDTMQSRCFMRSQEIIDRLVWYFFKDIICVYDSMAKPIVCSVAISFVYDHRYDGRKFDFGIT